MEKLNEYAMKKFHQNFVIVDAQIIIIILLLLLLLLLIIIIIIYRNLTLESAVRENIAESLNENPFVISISKIKNKKELKKEKRRGGECL